MAQNIFLRVRCDKELKVALKASADISDRTQADQVRYILRLALGLSTEEEEKERLVNRLKRFRDKPWLKNLK